jgi:hemoglobin-like flavoprotein
MNAYVVRGVDRMDIEKSLKLILQSGDQFGASFYDIFFERCPKAAEYFKDTDMSRQSLVLTMALQLLAQYYANGFLSIKQYLQTIGTRHDDWGIPREMYTDWRDAMLAALEKFHGEQWNDALANQWREAIERATEAMFHGYDRRAGV